MNQFPLQIQPGMGAASTTASLADEITVDPSLARGTANIAAVALTPPTPAGIASASAAGETAFHTPHTPASPTSRGAATAAAADPSALAASTTLGAPNIRTPAAAAHPSPPPNLAPVTPTDVLAAHGGARNAATFPAGADKALAGATGECWPMLILFSLTSTLTLTHTIHHQASLIFMFTPPSDRLRAW